MKKRLIQWIILDQQPFTIVEKVSFQNFLQTLYPKIKLPTANTIKNQVLGYHESGIKVIQEILQNVPGKISFTTDIWTSVAMKSFLTITAYFINKEWELETLVLDFVQIWGAHTGENLKNIFISCLENFKIQTKVNFILFIYLINLY
jgi:hypothetical protein